MSNEALISIIISIGGFIVALAVAITNNNRNVKTDAKNDTADIIKMGQQIAFISDSITEIKNNFADVLATNNDFRDRLAKGEAKIETMNKSMGRLYEDINSLKAEVNKIKAQSGSGQ